MHGEEQLPPPLPLPLPVLPLLLPVLLPLLLLLLLVPPPPETHTLVPVLQLLLQQLEFVVQ